MTDADLLGDEITELYAYISAATRQFLVLIREFDEHECWAAQGFLSCAHWLNFNCGLGMNAAREHLRVAKALELLPKVDAEFEEGKLSYSKVRAITRAASPENEDLLLMTAKHGTANQLERLVSQYRRAKKFEDRDFAFDQYRAREAEWRYDEDGCVVIKAKLPPDMGEVVLKALDKSIDVADVGGSAGSVGGGSAGDSVAARRADALADIAETYLSNSDASGSTADRYQIVVHVGGGADSVGGGFAGDTHIQNGPHVSAETSERIACDCSKVEIEECAHGEPLSIGRRSRTIPPTIYRALRARDGGCRFPGCTNHRYVDGHHIVHWRNGGDTALGNLVLLCRHHHRLVHEGGFDCRKPKDGEIYFLDRRKQRLPDNPTPRETTLAESLAWMYREYEKYDVSAETSKAGPYAGERMDYDHALMVMLQ